MSYLSDADALCVHDYALSLKEAALSECKGDIPHSFPGRRINRPPRGRKVNDLSQQNQIDSQSRNKSDYVEGKEDSHSDQGDEFHYEEFKTTHNENHNHNNNHNSLNYDNNYNYDIPVAFDGSKNRQDQEDDSPWEEIPKKVKIPTKGIPLPQGYIDKIITEIVNLTGSPGSSDELFVTRPHPSLNVTIQKNRYNNDGIQLTHVSWVCGESGEWEDYTVPLSWNSWINELTESVKSKIHEPDQGEEAQICALMKEVIQTLSIIFNLEDNRDCPVPIGVFVAFNASHTLGELRCKASLPRNRTPHQSHHKTSFKNSDYDDSSAVLASKKQAVESDDGKLNGRTPQ